MISDTVTGNRRACNIGLSHTWEKPMQHVLVPLPSGGGWVGWLNLDLSFAGRVMAAIPYRGREAEQQGNAHGYDEPGRIRHRRLGQRGVGEGCNV